MGATPEQGIEADFNAEYPIHNVQLSSYYIGVNEVTQGLWRSVMGDSLLTPERQTLGLGDNLPVHNISWKDANGFVKKLTVLMNTERESYQGCWDDILQAVGCAKIMV